MPCGVEGVVDRRVGRKEPLGGGLGLEPMLLSLPSSDRQVGVFRSVVFPLLAVVMDVGKPEFGLG